MRNFRMHFRLHSGGVSARIAIDSIHYYKEDNMKKSVLRKYATLIATVGVNVQKGQDVYKRQGLPRHAEPSGIRLLRAEGR